MNIFLLTSAVVMAFSSLISSKSTFDSISNFVSFLSYSPESASSSPFYFSPTFSSSPTLAAGGSSFGAGRSSLLYPNLSFLIPFVLLCFGDYYLELPTSFTFSGSVSSSKLSSSSSIFSSSDCPISLDLDGAGACEPAPWPGWLTPTAPL